MVMHSDCLFSCMVFYNVMMARKVGQNMAVPKL
jgi:hypothetical protein